MEGQVEVALGAEVGAGVRARAGAAQQSLVTQRHAELSGLGAAWFHAMNRT